MQEDTLEGTERSEAGRGWDCCSLEGSWSTLADWVGWEGGLLDREGRQGRGGPLCPLQEAVHYNWPLLGCLRK